MMLSASLAEAKEEEKEQTLQEEITEYIYHHVQAVSYTHLTLPTKA